MDVFGPHFGGFSRAGANVRFLGDCGRRHPRFQLHFTPTSSSWLNLVERWFRELTGKRLRRGVFRSVDYLTQAIQDFLAAYNDEPKPFVWTTSVDAILAKVNRCKAILETDH